MRRVQQVQQPLLTATVDAETGVTFHLSRLQSIAGFWDVSAYLHQLMHEISLIPLSKSGYALQLFRAKHASKALRDPMPIYKTIASLWYTLSHYKDPKLNINGVASATDISENVLRRCLADNVDTSFTQLLKNIRLNARIRLLLKVGENIDNYFALGRHTSISNTNQYYTKNTGLNAADFYAVVQNQDWNALQEALDSLLSPDTKRRHHCMKLLHPEHFQEQQAPRSPIDYEGFMGQCPLPLRWSAAEGRYAYDFPLVFLPSSSMHYRLQELLEAVSRVPLVGGGHFVLFEVPDIPSFLQTPEEVYVALKLLVYVLNEFHSRGLFQGDLAALCRIRYAARASAKARENVLYLFCRSNINLMFHVRIHAMMVLLQQGWSPSFIPQYIGVHDNEKHIGALCMDVLGMSPLTFQKKVPIAQHGKPQEWGCRLLDGKYEYFLAGDERAMLNIS